MKTLILAGLAALSINVAHADPNHWVKFDTDTEEEITSYYDDVWADHKPAFKNKDGTMHIVVLSDRANSGSWVTTYDFDCKRHLLSYGFDDTYAGQMAQGESHMTMHDHAWKSADEAGEILFKLACPKGH